MIAIVAPKIIPTGKAAHPWSSDERTFRPKIMLSISNGRNVRSSFYKSHGIVPQHFRPVLWFIRDLSAWQLLT